MSKLKIYPVLESAKSRAHINNEQYAEMYKRSIEDSDAFWAEQAEKFVSWSKKWDKVQQGDFQDANIKWFEGAKLNVAYNCLDRHLQSRGDQTAIIWEGDEPDVDRKITYRELHEQVCRFANVLKQRGVKKGDCVSIYMPMIPEATVAMLACARIGAVHSVVFGGFSPGALKDRILDSDCKVVITADESVRGGRKTALKANTDKAIEQCPHVHTVVVVEHTGADISWHADRDVRYQAAIDQASVDCPAEEMDAEDPLFILYTSGSTGKPKGVLHSTGGYLLYVAITHKYIFDYHDGDIYWCGADIGWVTGHSYIVYGPLANGAVSLMFEGMPTYPDAGRFWQVIDKHQVNIFYTAPTALRALMGQGNDYVRQHSRKSLRLLGTVGEPINPEAWEWYYHVVGDGRCPIMDTWWQTETGGNRIKPLAVGPGREPGTGQWPRTAR
ncbi:MAG: acetate--CoA ligase [Gammaproteobacteria bacterium]|nr:acetate--CoA ligase [Gammaproteobacteria bacterium]